MIANRLKRYNLILASKSPRRQFLLKELGLAFKIQTKDTDESFPKKLKGKQIAYYLCKKKSEAFNNELKPKDLIITADTIVWVKNQVLNKPANYNEAVKMLKLLSGKMHIVFTGVCLSTLAQNKKTIKTKAFVISTKVFFKKLSNEEINFYVKNYKPYDKAGAYGAQEWIGYIGVEKIIGSYFNVMGLPMKELYEALKIF